MFIVLLMWRYDFIESKSIFFWPRRKVFRFCWFFFTFIRTSCCQAISFLSIRLSVCFFYFNWPLTLSTCDSVFSLFFVLSLFLKEEMNFKKTLYPQPRRFQFEITLPFYLLFATLLYVRTTLAKSISNNLFLIQIW